MKASDMTASRRKAPAAPDAAPGHSEPAKGGKRVAAGAPETVAADLSAAKPVQTVMSADIPPETPIGPEVETPLLTHPGGLAFFQEPLAPPELADDEDDGPEDRPIPLVRPHAKAEKFVEGDHVVYPTHGVGKVERIATEDIAGHRLELIHITFEENRMTLRVPVAKARSAGLRKLATRKLFDEAMTVLKGRPRIKRTMWSRRAQEYEAKINSGDPLSIAEVVRDLHRNAGQPDQSFSERQIYEAAMDRLAAELAALDRTDKTTAATKLVDFLKTV